MARKHYSTASSAKAVPVLENCGKWPYDNDADEFVRPSCRDEAGWRRDEWAQSPLFIWGKDRPVPKAQPGASTPAERPLNKRRG